MSNLSYVAYTGDGVTNQFLLSVDGGEIGYLRTEDIHVYVDDVEVTFNIETASPHLVILDAAPASGSEIVLRREMPQGTTYSDFSRGNKFGPKNMNNSFYQLLYLVQEILDGYLPEGTTIKQVLGFAGLQVKGLGEATEAGNALEFSQWLQDKIAKEGLAEIQDGRLDALEGSVDIRDRSLVEYNYTAIGGEVLIPTNYNLGYVQVSINGVIQIPNKAFSVEGSNIRVAEPLEEGDEVFVQIGVLYNPVNVSGEGYWLFTAAGGEVNIDTTIVTTSTLVTINGVVQIPTKAYEMVGTIISFAEPLEEGDEIYIVTKN